MLEGVELDAARGLAERWQKVDEIPFDFERRRMSVVVKEDDAAHQLICKGALQEILNVSTRALQRRYRTAGRYHAAPHSPVTDTLNRQGLRVVAVATKYLPAREGDYQRADESDLIRRLHRLPRSAERDHRPGAEGAEGQRHHGEDPHRRQRAGGGEGVP